MYRLFVDSDCDVTKKQCDEYGVSLISMPFAKKGELIYPYKDWEVFDGHAFYDELRGGVIPTTSALNIAEYEAIFEPSFIEGIDVLYVHFSRVMTVSFDNMDIAIKNLKERYPNSKTNFYEMDVKGITICGYSIVIEVMDMFKAGKSIQEILEWGENEVDRFATYFFADDLKFFTKSGRVSGLAGFMGNIIGIKPLLTMNSEGKMANIGKLKGTKNALKGLVDYMDQLKADDWREHRVILGHADSIELATKLRDMILEKYGGDIRFEFVEVNPTAGSHCGPNTVGLNFHAIHR